MLSIIQVFDQNDIDYALCGGLAVSLHGYIRYTNDIDLIILEKDLDKAKKILQTIGYDLPSGMIPFKQPDGSFRNINRIFKAIGPDLYTLDLMLCTGTLEAAWEDRELMEYEDQAIKVVSKESLIKMKLEAGRERDLNDVRELEALENDD
jgi:hypothetical protein